MLHGNLVLKGYGDPKITIEQWQAFMAQLRASGLIAVDGDLVLDRTLLRAAARMIRRRSTASRCKPYNVGPDALLVNFKSVRFVFAPDAAGAMRSTCAPSRRSRSRARRRRRSSASGECGDWRGALAAAIRRSRRRARAPRSPDAIRCALRRARLVDRRCSTIRITCSAMFATLLPRCRRAFAGGARTAVPPRARTPFATLESPPLYDVVRDVNKLSNNVMARQIFLTLATTRASAAGHALRMRPTPSSAGSQRSRLAMPGLVLENGSGLSRHERITAGSLRALLLAANAAACAKNSRARSPSRRWTAPCSGASRTAAVAGQALLKTGSLEGVRALAGYVIDANGRRFIVVAIVNHPNAARGARARPPRAMGLPGGRDVGPGAAKIVAPP